MVRGYNLYGLKLNSDIILNGYSSKKPYQQPNVILKFGKISKPKDDLDGTIYKPFTIFNKDIYYQDIPSIATYFINGSKEITIQAYPNRKNKIIALFFIDAILPILLIKNNIFPVHASAVCTEKGVYLFTSPHGTGKSTLATTLILRGFAKFVSDDLCILKWEEKNNRFVAKCFNPYVCLWRDTFPIFGKVFKKYKFQLLRDKLFKYNVDFSRHASKTYQPVKAIGIINVHNEEIALSKIPLKGIEKLNTTKKIIHSSNIANVVMKHKEIFHYTSKIAQTLDLFVLNRNNLTSNIEFSNFIQDEILTKTTSTEKK